MYKVFREQKAILITSLNDFSSYFGAKSILLHSPSDMKKVLKNLYKYKSNLAVIKCHDLNRAIESFENQFIVKVAAGGWVFNDEQKLLMIHRNDRWDIPKGHLEPNESLEACALREVEEECGISDLVIKQKLGITRYLFKQKGKTHLKVVHWYLMHSNFKGTFEPQIEEGIEKAQWVDRQELEYYLDQSFPSINTFFHQFVNPIINDTSKTSI